MDNGIIFAESGDAETLAELFLDNGMYLAGEVEDHILIKDKDEIVAAAFVVAVDDNHFHLAVFAVNESKRNTKIGSRLLREILKEPQKYCRGQNSVLNNSFQITTVSKGKSVGFYEKNGFVTCDFSQLNYPYDSQCEQCPEKEDCQPVPLIFSHNG